MHDKHTFSARIDQNNQSDTLSILHVTSTIINKILYQTYCQAQIKMVLKCILWATKHYHSLKHPPDFVGLGAEEAVHSL